jgi:hypothetical protein
MIARFDHRPMLTALLALATILLFVVVITLSTLLITSAPAPSQSSFSDGSNPAAPAGAVDQGFSNQSLAEQKAEVLAAQSGHFTQESPAEKKAEAVAAKSGHFAP